jgi:hypothetical protein
VPVFATRVITLMPPDVQPNLDTSPASSGAGVHSEAVAVDPATWEIVRFTLWTTPPSGLAGNATAFDILHASTPFLKDLPTGRLWTES